jgi:hypothetical protein
MMQGIVEVNNFIEKLHSMEYMIEPRASEITYIENRSLAVELTQALNDFSLMSRATIAPDPIFTQRAFNVITAAFAHGLVIDRNDIRKKLREAEELLKRCDEDKTRLEEDIKTLHQELLSCLKVKAGLEEILSRYESHEGDLT